MSYKQLQRDLTRLFCKKYFIEMVIMENANETYLANIWKIW